MGLRGLKRLGMGLAASGLLALTSCGTVDKHGALFLNVLLAPIEYAFTGSTETTIGENKRINSTPPRQSSSSYSQSSSSQSSSTPVHREASAQVDYGGKRITPEYAARHGGKPLQYVVDEYYARLGTPMYNYNDIFEISQPISQASESESLSSGEWQAVSVLFGLMSLSPAATLQQSAVFDLAGGASGRQAMIEGQKEAAHIVAGRNSTQNQRPTIWQKKIPRGANGTCVIRYPGGRHDLFVISDKEYEDIDRSGMVTINEVNAVSRVNKGQNVYCYGAGNTWTKVLTEEGKVAYRCDGHSFHLRFGSEMQPGRYTVYWYYPDGERGRVMAAIPLTLTGDSSPPQQEVQPQRQSPPQQDSMPRYREAQNYSSLSFSGDIKVIACEGWTDRNGNRMWDTKDINEAVGVHTERPVIARNNVPIYIAAIYPDSAVGKTSTMTHYSPWGEKEGTLSKQITDQNIVHSIVTNENKREVTKGYYTYKLELDGEQVYELKVLRE